MRTDVEKDQQGGSEKSAREQQEKRNFYQAELERLRNVAREELKRPVYKEPERCALLRALRSERALLLLVEL